MATISFYLLLYTDSGNVLELLLLISFCEAIMPTAIMAHLPFLINGAATSCDNDRDAAYGHVTNADDEDEEEEVDTATMSLEAGPIPVAATPIIPGSPHKKKKKKMEVCSIHVVFACMGISDAGVVMMGIAVLGYALDQDKGGWGAHIIFFFSAVATLLAITLIIAEMFVSRLYSCHQ